MQVYFIDNEDYFKRKAMYADEDGNYFEDNDERAIFFAKGVIETVKKLNWSPDIIHVHGWLASFLPLYLRNYYGNEPLFENSKIITSVYNQGFSGTLNEKVLDKVLYDGMEEEKLEELKTPDYTNLMKVAVKNSDAIIMGSNEVSDELKNYINAQNVPVLAFQKPEDVEQSYLDFYENKVLEPSADE